MITPTSDEAHMGNGSEREQFLIRAAVAAIVRSAGTPMSIAQITSALARHAPSVKLTMGEVKQAVFTLQRSGGVKRSGADVGIAQYVSTSDDDGTDPGIAINGDALTAERTRRAAADAAVARERAVCRIARLIRLEAEQIVGYGPSDDRDDGMMQQVKVDLTLDVLRKMTRQADAYAAESLRGDSRNRD